MQKVKSPSGQFCIVHFTFFIFLARHVADRNLLFTMTMLPIVLAEASGPSYSASWALVLFCVLLGLLVSLNSPRRTSEIKRPKDE
jgi:hypothetical protein